MRFTMKDKINFTLLGIFLIISVYGIIQGGRIGLGLMILVGINITMVLVRKIRNKKELDAEL